MHHNMAREQGSQPAKQNQQRRGLALTLRDLFMLRVEACECSAQLRTAEQDSGIPHGFDFVSSGVSTRSPRSLSWSPSNETGDSTCPYFGTLNLTRMMVSGRFSTVKRPSFRLTCMFSSSAH